MLNIEPEFHLPSCYNVQPPPANTKIGNFSDETLFFIFYSQPRDAMQEMAAHELCVPFYSLSHLECACACEAAADSRRPLREQVQAQLAVPQGAPAVAHQGGRDRARAEDGHV